MSWVLGVAVYCVFLYALYGFLSVVKRSQADLPDYLPAIDSTPEYEESDPS